MNFLKRLLNKILLSLRDLTLRVVSQKSWHLLGTVCQGEEVAENGEKTEENDQGKAHVSSESVRCLSQVHEK